MIELTEEELEKIRAAMRRYEAATLVPQAVAEIVEARLEEPLHRVAEAEQGFPLGLWWEPDEFRPDPRLK